MDATEVMKRIAHTLESGDASLLDDALAADAVVWHNDDGADVPAQKTFARAGRLLELVADLRVDVLEVHDLPATNQGVARFEIHGTVKAPGRPLRARNCIFLTFDPEGKVRRIDEYVDPTFAVQLGV